MHSEEGGRGGLRVRLSLESMCYKEPGDQVLLVVSSTSPMYEYWRRRGNGVVFHRQGKPFLQFVAEIVTNTDGQKIIHGELTEEDAKRNYRQGTGIVLVVEADERHRVEIKAVDIFNLSIEIWDFGDHPVMDYFLAMGGGKDLCPRIPIIEQLLGETDGDVVSTERLMSAYYRCKAKFLQDANTRLQKKLSKNKKSGGDAAAIDPERLEKAIRKEYDEEGRGFSKEVDKACSEALSTHFDAWRSPEDPLLDMSKFVGDFSDRLPLLFAALRGVLVSTNIVGRDDMTELIKRKEEEMLFRFGAMVRSCGKKSLTSLARIPTLARIGDGGSVSTEEMFFRIMLSSANVRAELRSNSSSAKAKQDKIIGEELHISAREVCWRCVLCVCTVFPYYWTRTCTCRKK
jgi:hypothetical protein